MTGIDEEFRNREIYAEKILYDSRLNQLLDTLGNVMNDFGGQGKAFTNVYPDPLPRHLGHQRSSSAQSDDPEKWDRARKAFLESEMVQAVRPRPEPPLGHGHARRRRRAVADQRAASAP